jgi:hypothetical protein
MDREAWAKMFALPLAARRRLCHAPRPGCLSNFRGWADLFYSEDKNEKEIAARANHLA